MKKVDDTPKYIRGKYTPAQGKSATKYAKEHYDEIKIRVKKGQRQMYANHAFQHNLSLNQFCVKAMDKAISEDMEDDKKK